MAVKSRSSVRNAEGFFILLLFKDSTVTIKMGEIYLI